MTSPTPREIVRRTLEFDRPPRVPRQLWALPWAQLHHGEALAAIGRDFPPDIVHADPHLRQAPVTRGDPYAAGSFVDEWGCTFVNAQAGVIGEVKAPLIEDWDRDTPRVRFPREWLTLDPAAINAGCAASDRFILAGCCPRPFERLQFLRGTANLYLDLFAPPPAMIEFMGELHRFYCDLLERWASQTAVDALMFMDDWGSQRNLLIDPALWRAWFKPLYRDYIAIAHAHGKKAFMHSDGHILAILPDLIELGLDAVNAQLFCIGLEALEPFAGRITFWGEIDRQHLLPRATPAQIDAAVGEVHRRLWRVGGCIAQCEFGPGARPENVRQVFASWDALG